VAGDHAHDALVGLRGGGRGESRDLRQLYSEDNPMLQDHLGQPNTKLYSAQSCTDV
jgi:hypothetical protein